MTHTGDAVPTTIKERRLPRVFVGLKVAPAIARELAQIARDLERFPARLVAVADIHLTLVPPWEEPSIPDASEKLRRVVAQFRPFPLTFRRVEYGPQPRRPRLLWAVCRASGAITALQAALVQAYGRRNERPFRPHVTLARLRANGSIIARRCPINRDVSLTQQVESVELFQSPQPGTRGYHVLESPRLGEVSVTRRPNNGPHAESSAS